MTQAYRRDETAIENQNDSKISLEKKRISFTKNFSTCDSRDSLSSVDGATKDQPQKISRMAGLAPMPTSIMRIERRATRPARTMFSNEKALPLFESCATAMHASIA
jgi:hypothetical protein